MNDKIVEKAGDTMTENKLYGESQNIEFKREIPNNHEKFLKDVIAFQIQVAEKSCLYCR